MFSGYSDRLLNHLMIMLMKGNKILKFWEIDFSDMFLGEAFKRSGYK